MSALDVVVEVLRRTAAPLGTRDDAYWRARAVIRALEEAGFAVCR